MVSRSWITAVAAIALAFATLGTTTPILAGDAGMIKVEQTQWTHQAMRAIGSARS